MILNAISSGDLSEWIPLLISNIGGLLINIVLLFWYLYVLLDHNKKQFLGYGFFVINLLVEIGYFIYRFIINEQGKDSFHLIGYVATVINICMYSSPYFNYKRIINSYNYKNTIKYLVWVNSKKSATIPLYTIISGLFTCLIFFIQGFVSFRELKDKANSKRLRQSNIETMISNTISFIIDSAEDLGINDLNSDNKENENINEGIN